MGNIIVGAISQGVLYAMVALGLYITFRILNLADLTMEGSFTLGGATCARLIFEGVSPLVAMLASVMVGALAGCVTGILHTKFKIHHLLAGILTMTGLYSINLRIMAKPTLSLLRITTIFEDVLGIGRYPSAILIGIIIVAIVILLLWIFFKTEIGYCLKATGDNEQMVRSLGMNTDLTKILGLMLGNGLVALGGALIAQYQGYSDINMGVGIMVIALASLIIGEVVIRTRKVALSLLSIVVGSIIYRIIIAFVLQLNFFSTDDFRLMTAAIVMIALIAPNFLKREVK